MHIRPCYTVAIARLEAHLCSTGGASANTRAPRPDPPCARAYRVRVRPPPRVALVDSGAMANTNRCSDSYSCAHPNVRCNAHPSARTNIPGYAHSDRDPYANGHRDTHPNLGANTHANLHTDTHANLHTDTHANLHTDTHANLHANTHTDTHANTRTWKPRCD